MVTTELPSVVKVTNALQVFRPVIPAALLADSAPVSVDAPAIASVPAIAVFPLAAVTLNLLLLIATSPATPSVPATTVFPVAAVTVNLSVLTAKFPDAPKVPAIVEFPVTATPPDETATAASKEYPDDAPANASALAECVAVTSLFFQLTTPT